MMHENLIRINAVCLALKDLEQEYVFVGGATVSLYATDQDLRDEVRLTDDVDVIVELATYAGYSDLVMPTDPIAIGFSNRWYPVDSKVLSTSGSMKNGN